MKMICLLIFTLVSQASFAESLTGIRYSKGDSNSGSGILFAAISAFSDSSDLSKPRIGTRENQPWLLCEKTGVEFSCESNLENWPESFASHGTAGRVFSALQSYFKKSPKKSQDTAIVLNESYVGLFWENSSFECWTQKRVHFAIKDELDTFSCQLDHQD